MIAGCSSVASIRCSECIERVFGLLGIFVRECTDEKSLVMLDKIFYFIKHFDVMINPSDITKPFFNIIVRRLSREYLGLFRAGKDGDFEIFPFTWMLSRCFSGFENTLRVKRVHKMKNSGKSKGECAHQVHSTTYRGTEK